MAIRLTARPLSRANIHIDEADKVHIYPCIRPSAGEAFGVESEREERDIPTPDLTHAAAQWHFIKGFAWGAAVVLCIAAAGWAISPR